MAQLDLFVIVDYSLMDKIVDHSVIDIQVESFFSNYHLIRLLLQSDGKWLKLKEKNVLAK